VSTRSRLPETTARAAPENLAILLREPFQAMTDLLIARLAVRGHDAIRSAHGAVFEFLDDDGTRVSVLAERARITKQSMAELVAHLEAHGYVARASDPADGRAKLVRATARGREVYAIARELVAETEAALAARLGANELAELRRLLTRLGEALDDGPIA
jgi:DNA-binding MarR family transcriptional regulator